MIIYPLSTIYNMNIVRLYIFYGVPYSNDLPFFAFDFIMILVSLSTDKKR